LKRCIILLLSVALFSIIPLSFSDQGTYSLKSDEKSFDVSYSFDGDLVAIDVDKESTSLLVGMQNVKDSIFTISFPSELLSAQNSEFVALVDGLETDYTVTYNNGSPTISFPIQADSEEVEIIGTSVVPEFPLGALFVIAMVSAVGIAISRTHVRLFK
jgi:hypothetical protein